MSAALRELLAELRECRTDYDGGIIEEGGEPIGVDCGLLKRSEEAIAALLAKSAAYEALVAEIDGSLVKTVEESGWGDESGDGRIYGIPDRFIGSRVRLLLVREGGDAT